MVGVGDKVAGVLRARGARERSCSGRKECEAKKQSERDQLLAFLSKWETPVETDSQLQNDTSVENQLQLEIRQTAAACPELMRKQLQRRFLGIRGLRFPGRFGREERQKAAGLVIE
jgi:hypothetical protein